MFANEGYCVDGRGPAEADEEIDGLGAAAADCSEFPLVLAHTRAHIGGIEVGVVVSEAVYSPSRCRG